MRRYESLFTKGEISKDNTIIPLGIDEPRLFRLVDETIGICGKRITQSGEAYENDAGLLWGWKTKDLIHFETLGNNLVDASRMDGADATSSTYFICDTFMISSL